MRLSFLAVPLLAFSLVACTTVPTQEEVKTVVSDVKQAVSKGCQFVVATQTVIDILKAFGVPYVGLVSDVAKEICDAVVKPAAARGARPTVRGVPIVGRFKR